MDDLKCVVCQDAPGLIPAGCYTTDANGERMITPSCLQHAMCAEDYTRDLSLRAKDKNMPRPFTCANRHGNNGGHDLSCSELRHLVPLLVLFHYYRPTLDQLLGFLQTKVTSLVHFLLSPVERIFTLGVYIYSVVVLGNYPSLIGPFNRCLTRLVFLTFF